MGVWVVIQARLGSTRLPAKTLRLAAGQPLIIHLLDRLLLSGLPLCLAVPAAEHSVFAAALEKYLYAVYPRLLSAALRQRLSLFAYHGGGRVDDVLARLAAACLSCAKFWGLPLSTVIRVTGDNPFISVRCLLSLLKQHKATARVAAVPPALSYYTGLPYGAGVEVLTWNALKRVAALATAPYDREHVTSYLHRGCTDLRVNAVPCPQDYYAPKLRVTVDTEADFSQFSKRLEDHRQYRLRSGCTAMSLRAVIPLRALITAEVNG